MLCNLRHLNSLAKVDLKKQCRKLNFNISKLAAVFLVFILMGCQTVSYDKPLSADLKDATPLEITWLYSKIRLPAIYTISGKEETFPLIWLNPSTWNEQFVSELASPVQKLPVAVFLHGCGGITESNKVFIKFLSKAGWVVFAPNSFARPGRSAQCYAQTSLTYAHRIQEARYALARLKEMAWVDQKRLVLVGHSEGGEAVGQWSYEGYSALIISGANCGRSGHRAYAPSNVAILSIVGENDPREDAPCSVVGRPTPSKSVTVAGAGHSVFLSAEGEKEILRFLKMLFNSK